MLALLSAHEADYVTWRSGMGGALRVFLFEKALGVLEIEEEGTPN